MYSHIKTIKFSSNRADYSELVYFKLKEFLALDFRKSQYYNYHANNLNLDLNLRTRRPFSLTYVVIAYYCLWSHFILYVSSKYLDKYLMSGEVSGVCLSHNTRSSLTDSLVA